MHTGSIPPWEVVWPTTPIQSTVTRETFLGVSSVGTLLFYLLSVTAVGIFVYGLYQRVNRYTTGTEDWFDRFDSLHNRLRTAVRLGMSNEKQFDRDWVAGLMHLFVMWGFLVLFIATSILFVDQSVRDSIGSFWVGDFYLVYQFAVDAFGLLFVVGLGVAAYRRYGIRLSRLRGDHTDREDDLFLWGLLAIGVTGLLLEGLRIYSTGMPTFEVVSFVGYGIGLGLDVVGFPETTAASLHWGLWWVHALLSLAFVAWLPYAKPVHMLTSFANLVVRDVDAGRRLPGTPADVDAEPGVASMSDFSWKELLDQDACTNCGRCASVCPATDVGRPLDPRAVILDLKAARDGATERDVIADGGVIAPETMESCMACMACMDACPVEIEHLKSFTRMNRQLVEEGAVDGNLQEVFGNLMQQGNTFGEAQSTRGDWADALPMSPPDARETDVEFLWYVGDYPSFDERNKQVARSLARILEAADVDWGILFADEQYDGNDVRRLGEELLYVTLAGHHVETFEDCEFETIICTDPHSFNTFKNEYPEIDFAAYADDPMMPFEYDDHWNQSGEIDVMHWTQAVAQLVTSGRLDLTGELEYTVTYHDPCHLGRYNDEYEAPRELIRATGCDLVELPRNRNDSYCCGGGGGGLWLDQSQEVKPSEERLREAIVDTDHGQAIEKFVVTCPMCLTMYEDGRKTGGYEDDLDVIALAELVDMACQAAESGSAQQ